MVGTVVAATEDTLLNMAKSGIVEVCFTKKDGTERILFGSLSEKIVPQSGVPGEGAGRPKKDGLIVLWDTQKKAWRSFNLDQINYFSQHSVA